MPRSPSGQFAQIVRTAEGRFLGAETEERGWWSLQYQQVFRGFQRQDSYLSDVDVRLLEIYFSMFLCYSEKGF